MLYNKYLRLELTKGVNNVPRKALLQQRYRLKMREFQGAVPPDPHQGPLSWPMDPRCLDCPTNVRNVATRLNPHVNKPISCIHTFVIGHLPTLHEFKACQPLSTNVG